MLKSKVQAIGLLVAVTVTGFASGAATASWAGERSERSHWRERCSYTGMLQHELGLTGAQRDSLRAVMRRHRPQMRAVFERVRPEMDSLRAAMHAEMRTVLTPAQQAAFDSLRERERAERARQDRTNAPRR